MKYRQKNITIDKYEPKNRKAKIYEQGYYPPTLTLRV